MTPALVDIPGGSFLMGGAHRVEVAPFALAACQTTNAQYALFLAETGHPPPPMAFPDPEQPVVAVSWLDAVSYCEWLSRVTGRAIRLPSEAEWEYAARGGIEGAEYPWGNTPPESRPGYATRWLDGPERVGRGAPNAFGIYDLCENVHEWCSDWYSTTRRASRGGSWRHHVKISRCAARSSLAPELRYADYGFRVAADYGQLFA